MSIKIFTITHKPFTPPPDSMYIPLHVGRTKADNLGFLGDDTGDNISHLNPNFCELTGMYWLWKNYHDADYIGICHYRRYLINEKGAVFEEKELEQLLQRYDIITTKLLTLTCSYEDGFSANHHRKDLLTTGSVIHEKYPEYWDTFNELLHGPHTYFGNIFITSRDIYERYCQWLFDILFAVQKQTDFTGYNDYQKRLFGFLSEFLQTVWIRYHQMSTYECMVGMVGEKYETRKLKEQLAFCFEKRNYSGAKSCFLEHYQKRPDVLMEASDVNGELRLCMQIISTCEFEDEAYGHCILDIFSDYHGLVEHFIRLNLAVSNYINGYEKNIQLSYLKENPSITPVSLKIAVQLFCKDISRQSAILHELTNLP